MLERYRPAPVGTLWVDMPHVHPDVEPLGTVQDDDLTWLDLLDLA